MLKKGLVILMPKESTKRFTKVGSEIWCDSEKFEELNHFDKLVYLYLLTNEHNNSAGFYTLKDAYAIADLKCDIEQYRNSIETVSYRYRNP